MLDSNASWRWQLSPVQHKPWWYEYLESIEVADIRSYHCNEGEFLTDLPSVNSHASIVKDKKFPLSKFDLEWEKKAKIAHIFTNFHQLLPIWNLTPLPAAAGSQVWFITNAVQCLSPITTSNQLRHRYILFYKTWQILSEFYCAIQDGLVQEAYFWIANWLGLTKVRYLFATCYSFHIQLRF